MSTARATFVSRYSHALESEEQVLGRELYDFEAEGLEVHVANRMLEDGLIEDISEVIS